MAASNQRSDGVEKIGDDAFEAVVDGDELVLVEFFTEWCGTCTQMEPLLERIDGSTAATVRKVDIESNLETAIEFGAQRTPTFVLFVDGRPVKQLHGAQTESTLRDLVDAHTA